MKTSIFPLAVLLSLVMVFSCEDKEDPTACWVKNPTENLPWLKEYIENIAEESMAEYAYVGQATWGGQTVFFTASCCPHCNWFLIVHDCAGNRVEQDISLNDLEDRKVLWKSTDSLCSFD